MSSLKPIRDDLAWLTERWPDLVEARLLGTRRPWRQEFEVSRQAQDKRNVTAWLERHDRLNNALSGGRPPLHVDVLDLMAEVLMRSDLLHEKVAQTVGHPRLDHATGIGDDPRRFWAYTTELLREACDTDLRMETRIAEEVAGIKTLLMREFGEIDDGQVLDAICPFCLGRTDTKPIGGARTLTFRGVKLSGEDDVVVVCEGGHCAPFANECSVWVKGAPAWRWPEWDWLSARLIDPRSVGVA